MASKNQKNATWKSFIPDSDTIIYTVLIVTVIIMIILAIIYRHESKIDPTEPLKPRYKAFSQPTGLVYGCPSMKSGILLTFDDGPSTEQHTQQILQGLADTNITGIFFVSPKTIRSQPELLQKINENGHSIGVSINENEHEINSIKDVAEAVNGAEKDILNVTGQRPLFLRFTNINFINSNTTNVKDLLKSTSRSGYTVVMGSNSIEHIDIYFDDQNDQQERLSKLSSTGAIVNLPLDAVSKLFWSKIVVKKNEDVGNGGRFLSPKECFDY